MNLFFFLIGICCITLWTKFASIGRVLLTVTFVTAFITTLSPLGEFVFWKLENRFPQSKVLPSRIDGIIIAGGVLDPILSYRRQQPSFGGSVERIIEAARIGTNHPNAKIIFSGGSGNLFRQEKKEAHFVLPFLNQLGISSERVFLEDKARNTVENATLTHKLVSPKENEVWLLVTSAFHMPRAMGTYRKAGWKIRAYPVDFITSPNFEWNVSLNIGAGLNKFSGALKECLGLLFYWLTGKTDSVFPSPSDKEL